jgi:outer membrane protein assembly factor BamB
VIAGGKVVVCQARGKATFALPPGGEGRRKRDAYVWKYDGPSSDVCTPLAYKGLLYVLAGDKKIMTCLDPADGTVIWSHAMEAKGPWRASPTGADGKIYCISEGGDVVILAAGRQFRELSRFATGARPCRASIVPAAGSVFIRLSKHLLCVRGQR